MMAEKKQEINGEKGRRPLRFPFQVEKREDVNGEGRDHAPCMQLIFLNDQDALWGFLSFSVLRSPLGSLLRMQIPGFHLPKGYDSLG